MRYREPPELRLTKGVLHVTNFGLEKYCTPLSITCTNSAYIQTQPQRLMTSARLALSYSLIFLLSVMPLGHFNLENLHVLYDV